MASTGALNSQHAADDSLLGAPRLSPLTHSRTKGASPWCNALEARQNHKPISEARGQIFTLVMEYS